MSISIVVTATDAARRDALLEALARAGLPIGGEAAPTSVGVHETATGLELTAGRATFRFSGALAPDDVASVARLGLALAGLDQHLRKHETDETVALVAAMASHDANNVLVSIQAAADALITHEDDTVVSFARILLAGCRRIAATLRRVSKVGHGTVGRVDVNAVVQDLWPLLTTLVAGRAKLVTRLESPLPLVWIDSSALERALVNLVANGGEAVGPGGRIVVASSARQADDGSQWVVVEVEDNGAGMDEATRARAFEPFFTTRAGAGGTGLGLASVARAVREAGGRIELDSAPGRGARFALWLPAT